MIPAYIVILFAHWFADFPVQAIGHKIMGRKATSLLHLVNHVALYSLWLMVICIWTLDGPVGWWALANGVLHGCIDFWTSKGTYHHYRLWMMQHNACHDGIGPEPRQWNIGSFFTIIGFDQFLHVAFLFWSAYAMGVM